MSVPNFVVQHDTTQYVLLKDLGPWDYYCTITNAPEEVVEHMVANGLGDRRLFYIDSEGQQDELKVKDGRFDGFAPGFPFKENKMKIMKMSCKCSDMFNPSPSTEHWGDYVMLDIDIETGQIVNWKKPTQDELDETFKGESEDRDEG
jgi:hypothetical protein